MSSILYRLKLDLNLFSVAQTLQGKCQCTCKLSPLLTMHAGMYYDTIGADDFRQFHPSLLRISGAV